MDKKIICAGTIIGNIGMIKIFCQKMWKAVKYKLNNNFDQAIMNYLIYENLLPIENLIEIDVESGEIFTMALADNFSVSGDKILRNGSAPWELPCKMP